MEERPRPLAFEAAGASPSSFPPTLATVPSLSADAPSEAASILAQLREALADAGLVESAGARSRVAGLSADQAVEAFRRSLLDGGSSPWTAKMYSWSARTLLDTVGKTPAEVMPSDLDRFRRICREERRHTARTARLTTYGVRAFFRFLGLATARKFRAPKSTESLPSYLTEREIGALLQESEADPRLAAIVHLLAYAGLRLGELRGLERSDIDAEHGTLRVRKGKGGKDRYVALDPQAAAAVERYVEARAATGGDGEGRLFPVSSEYIERTLRELGRRAGLGDRVHPHLLRHSLATALLRRGCDIRYIQRQLGHASIATTQIYAHVEIKDLRSAYSRARPAFAPQQVGRRRVPGSGKKR